MKFYFPYWAFAIVAIGAIMLMTMSSPQGAISYWRECKYVSINGYVEQHCVPLTNEVKFPNRLQQEPFVASSQQTGGLFDPSNSYNHQHPEIKPWGPEGVGVYVEGRGARTFPDRSNSYTLIDDVAN